MAVIQRRKVHHRGPADSVMVPLGIGLTLLSLIVLYLLTIWFSSAMAGSGGQSNGDPGTPKRYVSESSGLLKNPSLYMNSFGLRHNRSTWIHNNEVPSRVKNLLRTDEIVGDYLGDVQSGSITVDDVLRGKIPASLKMKRSPTAEKTVVRRPKSDKPPMTMTEIIDFLSDFLHLLHETCAKIKTATYQEIWEAYHELTVTKLYPWDKEYLERMPERRDDDSIFVSLASYRDENCLSTIKNAYANSKNPNKLNIGLVQQNCEAKCRSGVLEGGKMEDVEPDEDCHKVFCSSPEGKPHCDAGRVRALHVQESESLGPYAARYFASKLWDGEPWFMQIDSHMTFLQDWDAISVDMLQKAPSEKPVLSHYPPSHEANLERRSSLPAPRLCGPVFADSEIEGQIIRLEGSNEYDKKKLEHPRFAPFIAAGYFVAHSEFLREVPYDPFLPWIFMGEEIIMSARFYTHGYDIFSPTISVLGHIYVRRHKPKFWESMHRTFTFGISNPLGDYITNRIKMQLGYPESARDMIQAKSIFTAVDEYSMGTVRKMEDYLDMVGLDMTKKEVFYTAFCETGQPPKGFEQYASLYE
mmetsp:Transcript_58972/g.70326  ORF Transcript_58972/g.70326 Transcript_58972/m.70326 type:complete len:582 (-) Transcript_58972:182-1927(-)|eukprot:CAMPEP_0172497058 /NCGR_PEP_ID=MMETSP1066-20121228/94773_1 /TAXON_ID=671091 /ORGANISM="Coscinodiscus wailesii, Strain CCMP2513" /LENGTH=581 /DNA_ID=CAMNT_0013269633 /DNA_START=37 /DNA_END=1782 /DNA_ORIENTATION=+